MSTTGTLWGKGRLLPLAGSLVCVLVGRPALSVYHSSARDMCQGFGTCVGTVSVDMKVEEGGLEAVSKLDCFY